MKNDEKKESNNNEKSMLPDGNSEFKFIKRNQPWAMLRYREKQIEKALKK